MNVQNVAKLGGGALDFQQGGGNFRRGYPDLGVLPSLARIAREWLALYGESSALLSDVAHPWGDHLQSLVAPNGA
ncbi:hypothetical protein [Paraburkholderia sediminicola]|uniref:hypothetical protein n=1 Tax=Paraburkholderia sediminicola TaxID=458836 RepID=UPI0038BB6C10